MKLLSKFIFLNLYIFSFVLTKAQTDSTDLFNLMNLSEETNYTTATFKTTRIINGHSIENQAMGVLDFRINHRFGDINGGAYEWFGLDQSNVKLCLDYGIIDRLMVGIGRTNVNKTVDGYLKFKILRQSTGKKKMPITLSYIAISDINTLKWQYPSRKNYFTSRLTFTHQLLIGRKFSKSTSLQISPTLVHRNLVELKKYKNDVFVIGVGGRQKINKRISVNAEYFYVFPKQISDEMKNSLCIGFDIETGGHVFQLHFTNSRGMTESQFITQTIGNWLKGDIRFGFNISRVFTVKERKH
ncbi:MAG: hypothetical protein IT243_04425 [Bacteroidia bacterium]|nr:hypothetical protein [Bacteroidia bacterium]